MPSARGSAAWSPRSLFGMLIESGSRASVFAGYAFGAALMLGAAIVAALFAVRAERKPLEDVATPLSAVA